ncbi:MAG: rRNA pseudouridine synthase [Firmicutes bacterium]|nr:rRNA pseudouridine synthase [Bacillota bacterium]MCL2770709.1 rRNA pseudouridine synthase [Bacillota bacterium]
MRLNKYIASTTDYSRRKSEDAIKEGRVLINNEVVKNLATTVGEEDVVELDGKILFLPKNFVYICMNKPKGYITSVTDDRGRKTVLDLIKEKDLPRIYPVGRLDYDTEGMLILTNDGELTRQLTHPSSKVKKIYQLNIEGELSKDDIKKLETGVTLEFGYKTAPATVEIIEVQSAKQIYRNKVKNYIKEEEKAGLDEKTIKQNLEDNPIKKKYEDPNFKITRFQLSITEGKNRQVRKMLEAIGKHIILLKRVQIGQLKMGGLNRGEYKFLTPHEAYLLKQ